MDAMIEAGFSMVFLGIESPNPEALRRTNKLQNTVRGDDDYLFHAVRAIQEKGMEVTGGFILGLDGDGPEVFEAQVDFIQRAGIPIAMVGLLTALRGTNLYTRLEREGRLLSESTGNNVATPPARKSSSSAPARSSSAGGRIAEVACPREATNAPRSRGRSLAQATAMRRGLAFSLFGRVTVSTPFLRSAPIRSWSMIWPREKRRKKLPMLYSL